jgi:hypothetical protein
MPAHSCLQYFYALQTVLCKILLEQSCWTLSNVRCCWVTSYVFDFIMCEYSIEVDISVFLCVLYRVHDI